MVSGNAFGLEFLIRLVHIFQNTDLNNVVLVVGIMAVDFDCAWVHLRNYDGLGWLKMFSGGACGARQLAICLLEIARHSNNRFGEYGHNTKRWFARVARS